MRERKFSYSFLIPLNQTHEISAPKIDKFTCFYRSLHLDVELFLKSTFLTSHITYTFFSIWVFFHEHSRFTGRQRKGEGNYLTPLYHLHLLRGHLDIGRMVTAGS